MADRFLDFIDMIDGGGYGEGKMGDRFEGGGIFSMLANALATPYGSEDKERMRRVRQMRGLLAPDESIAPSAAPRPTVTRGGGGAGQAQAQVRPQARPCAKHAVWQHACWWWHARRTRSMTSLAISLLAVSLCRLAAPSAAIWN